MSEIQIARKGCWTSKYADVNHAYHEALDRKSKRDENFSESKTGNVLKVLLFKKILPKLISYKKEWEGESCAVSVVSKYFPYVPNIV